MNFLKYKIMSFLFLGFVAIHASDEALHNNLSAMSMQDSATDESVRNDVEDDILDVEVCFEKDFANKVGTVSRFPVRPNVTSQEYNREDLILRNSLAKTMMQMLMNLFEPKIVSDNWLREINATNTLFMDLHLYAKVLPESNKTEQTALMCIIPREDVDMNEFDKDVESVVQRFKEHGISMRVMISLLQDILRS